MCNIANKKRVPKGFLFSLSWCLNIITMTSTADLSAIFAERESETRWQFEFSWYGRVLIEGDSLRNEDGSAASLEDIKSYFKSCGHHLRIESETAYENVKYCGLYCKFRHRSRSYVPKTSKIYKTHNLEGKDMIGYINRRFSCDHKMRLKRVNSSVDDAWTVTMIETLHTNHYPKYDCEINFEVQQRILELASADATISGKTNLILLSVFRDTTLNLKEIWIFSYRTANTEHQAV